MLSLILRAFSSKLLLLFYFLTLYKQASKLDPLFSPPSSVLYAAATEEDASVRAFKRSGMRKERVFFFAEFSVERCERLASSTG